MNRALASTSASVTVVPYESQLFQPIGGRHALVAALIDSPFRRADRLWARVGDDLYENVVPLRLIYYQYRWQQSPPWATKTNADAPAGSDAAALNNELGDPTNMYYATTADFRTFSDPVQWIDRKNVIIDTTMLRDDDGWWYRASKDSEITIERTRNPYAVAREVLRTDDPNEWSFVGTLTDLLGNGRYSEHYLEGPELFVFNDDDVVTVNPRRDPADHRGRVRGDRGHLRQLIRPRSGTRRPRRFWHQRRYNSSAVTKSTLPAYLSRVALDIGCLLKTMNRVSSYPGMSPSRPRSASTASVSLNELRHVHSPSKIRFVCGSASTTSISVCSRLRGSAPHHLPKRVARNGNRLLSAFIRISHCMQIDSNCRPT